MRLLLLLVALTFTPPASAADKPSKTPSKAAPARGTKPGWKPITSSEGGFSIRIPGEPSRSDENGTVNEVPVTFHVLRWRPARDAPAFSVDYFDVPSELRAKGQVPGYALTVYEVNFFGDLALEEGVENDTSEVKVNGQPALEYRGKGPDSQVVIRAIDTGSRVYVLIVGWPTGKAPKASDQKAFFDSFRLLPSPEQPR